MLLLGINTISPGEADIEDPSLNLYTAVSVSGIIIAVLILPSIGVDHTEPSNQYCRSVLIFFIWYSCRCKVENSNSIILISFCAFCVILSLYQSFVNDLKCNDGQNGQIK